jgi:hypothetical protein
MINRVFAAVAALLTLLALRPLSGHAAQAASGHSDAALLRTAALRLGTHQPHEVAGWMRHRDGVRSAVVGRDGRTLDVRFADGEEMLVLPKAVRAEHLSALSPARMGALRPHLNTGARAAVLEPFATELGLGSDAGTPEVNALQATGFTVTTGIDQQVSVDSLLSLSQDNVVYLHTHAGVNAYGAGVVASGEPADGDPAVSPFIADGSVMVVGVSGSNQQYYGITAQFITGHVALLRPGSLFFINGCALLNATDFWSALHSAGAGVLVSWDADATNSDNYLSGAAFFNVMKSDGASVASAIATLKGAGYGTSSVNGAPATLGFLGDGSITLASAAASGAANPPTATPTQFVFPTLTPTPHATLTPTAARVPTSTPLPTSTATPRPTATFTATPVPLGIAGLAATVKGGQTVNFDLHAAPGGVAAVHVTYPDGEALDSTVPVGTDGLAHVSFHLPDSRITRESRRASVTIHEGTQTTTAEFTIGYGPLDLSVEPRVVSRGATTVIWVHAKRNRTVKLAVTPRLSKSDSRVVKIGKSGWAKVYYVVSKARTSTSVLKVHAHITAGGGSGKTS